MNPDEDRPAARGDLDLPGDLKSLEAKLATLGPRADRLDRERLMFLAGQASVVRADRWEWRAACGVLTAAAAVLLALLITRPAVIEVPSPATDLLARTDGALPRPEHDDRDSVLSTNDAYRRNIEQLISLDFVTAVNNGATTGLPVNDRQRSPLTPAAWQQIVDEVTTAGPSVNESSSLPAFGGVHS